ncbi:UdgX family uracil-DNA binding protein [Terrimicrobium sacchariphilum]|uniref:UdgX family uracil-DNA binding protein n=1 Tax=Terrimicrobium sacchariphilum TaxID=690879 RepID=UPI00192CFCD5
MPESRNLLQLRSSARDCQGCLLWRNATQTVFGRGSGDARWVFVGEQPGDQEDQRGEPFVGPAGKLLLRALADAGVAELECYFTNVVKHFKWKPRGKRRIHQKPSGGEIAACRPWLLAELEAIRPHATICLGATAATAVLGPNIKVLRDRGKEFASSGHGRTWVTVHPAMLLRMPDRSNAEEEYRHFVRDIRRATNG